MFLFHAESKEFLCRLHKVESVEVSVFFRRIRSGTGSIYHKELIGESDGRGGDGTLGGNGAKGRGGGLLDEGTTKHDYIYEEGAGKEEGGSEVMGRWMMPQNRSPRLNLDLRGGREKSRIGNLTVEIAIANAKHLYKRSRVHVIQIFCMV